VKNKKWDVIHSSKRNDWRTPPELFRSVDEEFKFNLDVASDDDNHLCNSYFTEKDNALDQKWTGVCWCNPPYGRSILQWVKKAIAESNDGATVVMLTFACTDTAWFRHAWKNCSEIRLLTGRIRFLTWDGKRTAPAPKGSALLIFRPDMNSTNAKILLCDTPIKNTDNSRATC